MPAKLSPENGKERRILELLSRSFPNITAAATEIINLEAILNLPKGTEHFVADIHGENEAFSHILRNASGNIRRKVRELFETSLRDEEIRSLCSLIYYPERKLERVKEEESDIDGYYHITLHRLVKVLQRVSSKYTRSKVRKTLPPAYAYIIEELLHEAPSGENKQPYYNRVVETIISTGQADSFITAIAYVIQSLSIDRLHILGDIYDRGPGAHLICDMLAKYRDYDIQWGNHDALWMGAAAGNRASMANVLRISLRYGNMATLEDGYGINLVPLATFAMERYGDDPCSVFMPKMDPDAPETTLKSRQLTARMHKAIAIIQFKLEAALIKAHPEWGMEGRNLLHRISGDRKEIEIDGKFYPLTDCNFPTVDPAEPYKLTAEEEELMNKLAHSFMVSDKLHRHIHTLLSRGSMYKVYNGNLLFHASVPLNADGSLKEVEVNGRRLRGPELLDEISELMRGAFSNDTDEQTRKYAVDYYWYLWCGPQSPLFDKERMTTFERYFIKDKELHREEKGYYYTLRDSRDVCERILDAFGVKGEHRHIINGHVPVKASKGESPVRADGMMLVIDGGFAKAYHTTTGIAGYTLVYHSRGFELVQHEPFTSAEEAVRLGTDIVSSAHVVEFNRNRLRVADTDKGEELRRQISELRDLLRAYANGAIPQLK